MRNTLFIISIFIFFYNTTAFADSVEFEVEGRSRNLIFEYPKNVENEVVPLVMFFHGSGGNARWLKRHSKKINNLLIEGGYAVAFMNGSGLFGLNSWNAEHCCAYAAKKKINDVAYIDMAIDILADKYKIDRNNIILIGHSNGGMVIYKAIAELRNKIRAVVAVSTALFADQPAPKHAFSLFMIHSEDDEILPYEGGMSHSKRVRKKQKLPYLGFMDAVNLWKNNLNCRSEYKENKDYGFTIEFSDCDGRNFIRVLSLKKGGHKWNKEIEAVSITQMIFDFIKQL